MRFAVMGGDRRMRCAGLPARHVACVAGETYEGALSC